MRCKYYSLLRVQRCNNTFLLTQLNFFKSPVMFISSAFNKSIHKVKNNLQANDFQNDGIVSALKTTKLSQLKIYSNIPDSKGLNRRVRRSHTW